VKLDFIRPGKPIEKGMIESFNGRLRDGCLNVNEFVMLDDVKTASRAWRHDCNHCRPHGSLGNLTPSEYGRKRSGHDPEASDSSFKWFEKWTNVSVDKARGGGFGQRY
jgi:putative transposase